MWYGTDTESLIQAKKLYEEKYGHSPDGEMELEYGPGEEEDYLHDILEAIEKGVHIADLYPDKSGEW